MNMNTSTNLHNLRMAYTLIFISQTYIHIRDVLHDIFCILITDEIKNILNFIPEGVWKKCIITLYFLF